MPFDAFISYSHAADGELAPSLQRGLQRLAKPWSRRQALRIFRDDTGLSVNPALWQSITDALDASEYFILLASPAAAASEWVNQEIAHWMGSRPDAAARMLPVLTSGTWVWDNATSDIDWEASTAAPAALVGVFTSEPRHLDLVWAQSQDDLDLRNARFREAVADLAAPIHGIPKDELESEDVRQHRRALRVRRGAVAALLLLVVGLGVAGVLALRAAETARGALRDLEDANGNIDDLTAEGELLAAANQQAEEDLAETEEARADAEALAADARQDADVATAAREQAEGARASAEAAQAEAEAQQAEAEAARAAAVDAQAAAELGQEAAEQAAAEAAEAEADARRQEAQARAGEVAAQDARAAAEQASAAAAAAEAQARADEQAAVAASDAAREQEAEARRAEAAALAGERLAQAAEADAVAAEEAARAAEAAAAQAAAEAEELRRTAETAARAAEAATKAATLARSATAQTDPGLNALLAVESYCAVGTCGAGGGPQGLLRSSSSVAPARPASVLQADVPYDPAELDPFVPMIDAVARHQDLVRQLPGWIGHGVDVAVSGDGRTIVAFRDDGTARVWHPAAPDGAELGVTDGIGIAVSDDGTTVAVVTAGRYEVTSSGPQGAREAITLIDLSGGGGGGSWDLVVDEVGAPHIWAGLSFRPGSRDLVLIGFGTGTTMLFDPSIEPADGEVLPDYTIHTNPAAWYGSDRIVVVGPGFASVIRPGQPGETPIVGFPDDGGMPGAIPPPAPSAVSSAGGSVVIGYDDGSVARVRSDGSYEMDGSLDGTRIDDITMSADERFVITTTQAGLVRRLRTTAQSMFAEADVGVALSRRPIAVATGRGPAQALVVAVEERIEVWSPSLSWAGAFVREDVVAPPTSAGALLSAAGDGYVLSSPEGSVRLDDIDLPAHVSADGSTLVTAGARPRVGPVGAFASAPGLDVPPDHVVTGPLATTVDGSIAAAVVDGPDGGRSVMTFDGRSGARWGTYELPPRFDVNGPDDVEVLGLLVSGDAVVIQRREDDPTSFQWDERIEIHPLDGGPSATIPIEAISPMALTSGPGATLYVARLGGIITGYPVGGGPPVDVLDVGDVESPSALGVEPYGGRLLVIGYDSGRVELVNVQTGALITELSEHSWSVTAAVIGRSPGGLRVSTTSDDEGVVRTLDDPDLLRGTLCAMAGRDLTDLEWHRFVDAASPQPCARGLS